MTIWYKNVVAVSLWVCIARLRSTVIDAFGMQSVAAVVSNRTQRVIRSLNSRRVFGSRVCAVRR